MSDLYLIEVIVVENPAVGISSYLSSLFLNLLGTVPWCRSLQPVERGDIFNVMMKCGTGIIFFFAEENLLKISIMLYGKNYVPGWMDYVPPKTPSRAPLAHWMSYLTHDTAHDRRNAALRR